MLTYPLTLTKEERKDFDWASTLYTDALIAGDILADCVPDNQDWIQQGDIIFAIPEDLAYEIKELGEWTNHLWPSFGPTLKAKLMQFCNNVRQI